MLPSLGLGRRQRESYCETKAAICTPFGFVYIQFYGFELQKKRKNPQMMQVGFMKNNTEMQWGRYTARQKRQSSSEEHVLQIGCK